MSIYDNRDNSTCGYVTRDPSYATNKYILKWWTSEHDNLIVTQITRWQWVWDLFITDEIIKNTPSATIALWKKTDPLCSKYAWYNILMNFAAARAERLGYTNAIRRPERKVCPICDKGFIEDSLPVPLVQRLGIDRLDFCAPCLRDTIFQGTGNDSASEQDILKYLQDLTSVLGIVPPQNFEESVTDLLDLTDDERLTLLKLLKKKPTVERVKLVFDSWLNALIQSGVLEDGARKTSRGIQSIAKDGHVCLSLGEKTIDDYLHSHRIHHEKEPRYPEGNFRGDFKVGNTFIEYFGLKGNPEYDAKTKEKIRLCKKHNIILVEIYPQDLINWQRLENKLSVFLQDSKGLE